MSIVATMNPQTQPMDAETKSRLASVPAWGSYLYQNFLLPAFSPTASMSEWLNLNTPFAALTPRASAAAQQQGQQPQPGMDYFGSGWGVKVEEGIREEQPAPPPQNNAPPPFNFSAAPQPSFTNFAFNPQTAAPQMQQSHSHPSFSRNAEDGPSYYPQPYNYLPNASSISTSLLMNPHTSLPPSLPPGPSNYGGSRPHAPFPHRPSVDRASQPGSRASLSIVDHQLTHSPSPIHSLNPTPHQSPKRAGKRRFNSLDSEEHELEHDSEPEPDVPEGVERDGVIWGMKVDAYRALSARERKRVRNRISARTFRAKRKEHLSSLEESSNIKDLKLKLANEENFRLVQEIGELRRRLAKYES